MKRIHGGEMGDVTAGRAYWNQGVLWFKPHKKGQTEVQYQMRNWYNFPWLCGDHIVEQHIHNLDVMNWGIGAPSDPGDWHGRPPAQRTESAGLRRHLRPLRRGL